MLSRLTAAAGPLALTALLCAPAAFAAEYYVDPVAGAPGNNGSAGSPWRSVQTVVDSGKLKDGDTLYLKDGYHGALTIEGKVNGDWITIAAAEGATPRLYSVDVVGSRFWRLSGLDVSPAHGDGEDLWYILFVRDGSSDVTVEKSTVRTVLDASQWSEDDWRQKVDDGVGLRGQRIQFLDNTVRNVRYGIDTYAENSLLRGNRVDYFSGDGIRGLGANTTYDSNMITNCHNVEELHEDGFQAWSTGPDKGAGGGTLVGGVLRGNVFISQTDPDVRYPCLLQGIAMFDGMYEDWVIENNVVATNAWHGITVMGAKNVVVRNNTVVKWGVGDATPWISVTRHKDGRRARDSVIANNLHPVRPHAANEEFRPIQPGVTLANNLEIPDPEEVFVDPAALDFRLREGSEPVDYGSALFAPTADIKGAARPKGDGVDIGAYESW